MNEHAVIIKFKYGKDDIEELYSLEGKLVEAINTAEVGEYDGYEIATNLTGGTFYMYGPDADALFAVVLPTLRASTFMNGANVVRRYGQVDNHEAREEVTII